jgi:hypothetical protein
MSHWKRAGQGTPGTQRVDLQGRRAVGKHRRAPFVACTTNTTVTADNSGSIYTTRGASGAVTFTLPAKEVGLHYTFLNVVDQNMIIATDATNTMITFNDTAADSIAFSTGGNKVGAAAYVFCDGTKWYGLPLCKHTLTVA